MDLNLSLLLFCGLFGIGTGFVQGEAEENCTNYKLQFERVFSVPGDTAMLNTTLVSPGVFDFNSVPYNITWYNSGQVIHNQTGRVLVRGEALWFLNVTLDDDGEYVAILRTPFHCYNQSTRLRVDLPVAGQCGRPLKAEQALTKKANDILSCPLKDYIKKLNSYNINSSLTWYRGCQPIEDQATGQYIYRDKTTLMIKGVDDDNNHAYTCTLTFNLGGIKGSVSETILANVREEYSMAPQLREPTNTTLSAHIGSSLSQPCTVFVPGIGMPFIDILWCAGKKLIRSYDPSDRIYINETKSWQMEDGPHKGWLLEVVLTITELREEDFFINYMCQAQSSRGHPKAYFTLLPADPDLRLPIGSVFVCVTFLFITSVTVYYLFKVDIVLWFRRVFPVLYANKDSDGKLYDAYVAYPQPRAIGFSEEVETFALHTLPQVLEKSCGYKLFIAGRDCLPGEAIVDTVEENIQASRRLLLLYTAATFASKKYTSSSSNNNNLSKNNNSSEGDGGSGEVFDEDGGEVHRDTRQQLECVAAMHRSLLERTLKVVLVELEEISPAQLALFPESVRHLRKKQGAVCWWKEGRKSQRWWTCARTRAADEEKTGQDAQTSPAPSLSPSSRFWKKIRYHMPVRGKRATYPETTALLNL
ncbi:interleukin-1 receptor type 1 isoform X1 [Solea solea]|uniref:interleukin-1 receptor type 1 isoform X1 n=1 Tax=Solea solea TaxID=90069 RepID=UPI00272BD6FE|nr:interleukin-1 receptor type 1 isoform X1 [Solea solea]XP_058479364.1 interleukin-1 receptor type 1 isoform X1 [Solea solea]